jgi:hypothetical protein
LATGTSGSEDEGQRRRARADEKAEFLQRLLELAREDRHVHPQPIPALFDLPVEHRDAGDELAHVSLEVAVQYLPRDDQPVREVEPPDRRAKRPQLRVADEAILVRPLKRVGEVHHRRRLGPARKRNGGQRQCQHSLPEKVSHEASALDGELRPAPPGAGGP